MFQSDRLPRPIDSRRAGDYYGVRVRRYDDAAGEATGDPFDVIVRDIRIY